MQVEPCEIPLVKDADCGPDDFRTDEKAKDFVRKTRAWVHATINRGVENGSNGSSGRAAADR